MLSARSRVVPSTARKRGAPSKTTRTAGSVSNTIFGGSVPRRGGVSSRRGASRAAARTSSSGSVRRCRVMAWLSRVARRCCRAGGAPGSWTRDTLTEDQGHDPALPVDLDVGLVPESRDGRLGILRPPDPCRSPGLQLRPGEALGLGRIEGHARPSELQLLRPLGLVRRGRILLRVRLRGRSRRRGLRGRGPGERDAGGDRQTARRAEAISNVHGIPLLSASHGRARTSPG